MSDVIYQAHQAWQESMLRQLDELRTSLRAQEPQALAERCGGRLSGGDIRLGYWRKEIAISWPELQARSLPDNTSCSLFDSAMLCYYLRSADGTPLAERWVGYRELPGGAFYAQAFQGYSSDLLARAYGERPEAFVQAARVLDGDPLPGLPGLAYAFLPLPRIRLAAILYAGDEEFPARASILFDAAASHYMTTDGLAVLGSGLVGRLLR